MNDFSQRQTLRALRQDIQPRRDLWPDIAGRLEPRKHPARPRWWPLALAASLMLALPLAWQLRLPESVPAVSPDAPQGDIAGLVREADAMAVHYRAALAELSAAPLPAELRPLARALDQDAEALRDALQAQPHSIDLLHQLRRTYDQRLRLGQRVALG